MKTEMEQAREAAFFKEAESWGIIADSDYVIRRRIFERAFDAGYKYEPPENPEFDHLLSGAIEKVNDIYRREGFDAGYKAARAEIGTVAELKRIVAENERLKSFAEDVALEQGYHRPDGSLATGGMSTVELAFSLLGWSDPHQLRIKKGQRRQTVD